MAEGLRRPQGGCAEQKYREFCNTLSTGILSGVQGQKRPGGRSRRALALPARRWLHLRRDGRRGRMVPEGNQQAPGSCRGSLSCVRLGAGAESRLPSGVRSRRSPKAFMHARSCFRPPTSNSSTILDQVLHCASARDAGSGNPKKQSIASPSMAGRCVPPLGLAAARS